MRQWLRKFLTAAEVASLEAREAAVAKREQEHEENIRAYHEYKLVYTWEVPCHYTNGYTGRKTEFKVYYYFYETKDGRRRYELESSLADDSKKSQDEIQKEYEHFESFRKCVYPWLKGKRMPEIPTWEMAQVQDVQNALTGKTVT